jgi:4-hydroxy-tetrahydrodipicolinate synthase
LELDKSKLKGILPAIVTPMDGEGNLDRAATGRLISYLLNAEVDGIVPLARMFHDPHKNTTEAVI